MTKKSRDDSHRVRAATIGLLACCRCEYPLRQFATSSRHHANCPAHRMAESAMRAETHWSLAWVKSGKLP